MLDYAIQKGVIDKRQTNDSAQKGRYFFLGKLIRDYLKGFNVPYYDPCCPTASDTNRFPVRFNFDAVVSEYWNGSAWTSVSGGTFPTLKTSTLQGNTALTIATNPLYNKGTATAINATATATAAAIQTGLITSTSAAATTITLPTATALATQIGAVKGSSLEFIVDNTAGANTVTVAVGSGIVATSVLTGGTTLTVAASATQGVGVFRLTFISATAAILSRLA